MSRDNVYNESETKLRQQIEEYYISSQLTEAILHKGAIPETTDESFIGIAFLDVADYSHISKFLTPKENLILLNGLYTAFHNIIIRRRGYLNKIEGDSMMFQFGGPLDHSVAGLSTEELKKYIARELFFTCIEMQATCSLFNQADKKFIENSTNESQKNSLLNAFAIIETLRQQRELSDSMDAFFQIRIRIGASIGEVTVGNTGPPGAKQWDVIGNPVIEAKRMETTAPVGGLRISKQLYDVLEEYNYVDTYCDTFRVDADDLNSIYKDIRNDEIFLFRQVIIEQKNNATFDTYSVQVDTSLPRKMADQVIALLSIGRQGAEKAVEIIMAFRGNRYVVDEIEKHLSATGIKLQKPDILEIIFPKKHRELKRKHQKNFETFVKGQYTLHSLLELMGTYQDVVKRKLEYKNPTAPFTGYNEAMSAVKVFLDETLEKRKLQMVQRAYFFNIVLPLVKCSLQNSILEYQLLVRDDILEEFEILEELAEA